MQTNKFTTMKFYVSRSSSTYEIPCEEAVLLNPNRNKGWEDAVYGIEINTLEELLEFRDKYDDIIIRETYNDKSYSELEIEIYDYYRE